MRYIGCHLSSSAGFAAMGRTALSIGANTFQFFTRNPRGSRAKPVDPADVAAYLALAAKAGLGTILAHAPYTINPCSKDERTREFARLTLADDLRRMEYLPGNLYNFHPGSHTGQGLETGITQIADTLNAILNQRSQDMLAANNWNVVQYAVLVHMFAQVSGLQVGELVHVIADAHIYDRHVPVIEQIIQNEPKAAPKFLIDPSVNDFYAFTRDSFQVEGYEYSEFTGKIPIAV